MVEEPLRHGAKGAAPPPHGVGRRRTVLAETPTLFGAAQGGAQELGRGVRFGQDLFLDGAGFAEQVALAHRHIQFEDVDDLRSFSTFSAMTSTP